MCSTILSQTRATRNATVLIVVYYNEAVSAETGSPDPSPRRSEDRSAPGGVAFFPWGRFGCARTEPGGKSRVGRKTTCDSPGPSRSYARRIGSIIVTVPRCRPDATIAAPILTAAAPSNCLPGAATVTARRSCARTGSRST
jgi:hypothetical protein